MSDGIDDGRRRLLTGASLTVLAAPLGVSRSAAAPSSHTAPGELGALDRATTWLNSAPLTAAGLRGKVVLVQFWTYTCINWLRSEPYVRAWSQRYKDHRLVVIGVHAPEFPFERELDNVRRTAKELRID